MGHRSVAIACFLWPPAAGLLMFLTCLALVTTGTWSWVLRGTGGVDAAVSLGVATVLLAIPLTGVGMLVLIWLLGRGPISLGTTLMAGAAVGNVPAAVVAVAMLIRGTDGAAPYQSAGLILGRLMLLGVWLGTWLAALTWALSRAGGLEDTKNSPGPS